MKKMINTFSRVLCALLLCAGLVFAGCTEGPLGDDPNIEQGGNETPEQKGPATITLENVTYSSATFTGHLNVAASDLPFARVTIYYSVAETFNMNAAQSASTTSFDENQNFTINLTNLEMNKKYNYCMVAEVKSEKTYGDVLEFTTSSLNVSSPTDLSMFESANCYIVSNAGAYKFKSVKGNSSTSVGSVSSVAVLWESFGTSTTPSVGDLIYSVSYKDGYVVFLTAGSFKEGNAVIAAKDASGTILWSWHIWLTDQPQGQVYYDIAGTMMDRNLGATSATPGDVGALGLLYQWGRKDPFLGSESIRFSSLAKSTITWPSAVSSDSSTGTIAYATANPTTFIGKNWDWYYTGSSSTDDTRWTESNIPKSIYDPCPARWRVPDGGSNSSVWLKALSSTSYFKKEYDNSNKGLNFSGKFGSASTIWYPASGLRNHGDGSLGYVGSNGCYWSASPSGSSAYALDFNDGGNVYLDFNAYRALGRSVRCIQESK